MARRRDRISRSDEHNARGIELADRGWLDEAINEFQKAIELDPLSAHAHDNLGTVLAEKGRLFDALLEYLEAVRVDPESPSGHHYLASFLASHGQELALTEYNRTLELDYEFPDAHLNLGLALSERGDLNGAISELETAHQQAPDDELIQHELACCLIDAERYPEAIQHLKKIIKDYPEHIEAFVDQGIAYTAQGFFEQAEESLQKALELDMHDFSAHYHLAALYAAWERPEQALEHLQIAASQDREKLRTWLRDDRLFDPLRDDTRLAGLLS